MTIHGLAHVNIRASEAMIARVHQFYVDVVGLTEGPRPPFRSRGYWLYAGDRDLMHLTIDPAMSGDTPAGTGWLDHVAFAASGLDGMLARLEAANVPYEIDKVPSSGEAQVFFRDPAGIAIELNFAG
jgi:catechol 2,3-dioxygenase-like lactoylglutathione lyase family enzyme